MTKTAEMLHFSKSITLGNCKFDYSVSKFTCGAICDGNMLTNRGTLAVE